MGVSSGSAIEEQNEEPLLITPTSDTVQDTVVNYKGETVNLSTENKYGGWKSASHIIASEVGETIAYYGISSNLITYLTGPPLNQSTVAAATNINTWSGFVWMLPLLGGFLADSYFGRFHTILFSSLIYILGLGLLTLSVALPSLISQHECIHSSDTTTTENSCMPVSLQVFFFFSSLYLVAIGKAGFKPCAQAFAADQFDVRNLKECASKSSFFNWWFFGQCVGSSISFLILTYIQENINWTLGFGIPCIFMAIALLLFLLGTKSYRFSVKQDKENPLLGILRVFSRAAKNWRTNSSQAATGGTPHDKIPAGAHHLKFLDKALIDMPIDQVHSTEHSIRCSIDQVEDAKVLLRLVPIWITCLMYAVVISQTTTFFIKQGNTMDRSIGPDIHIPAASLLTVMSLSVIFLIPIYDRIFVPLARSVTSLPSGITMLQRIGVGMFLSMVTMVVAAVVEKKRLQIALDSGLIDMPKETIPLSLWWLAPQYLLIGVTEIFTIVGMQEFFYDQVPNGLRSMGIAFYLSIIGIGDFLSGFLIYVIEKVTNASGQSSWFSDNLNRAHLDYFYWLLVGLSAANLIAYLYFSKSHLYNKL
ncbi:protein NRT1/ PTR FAMILY 5.10-like [Papaver somniferum]|uniref:protein NRT1/ PTR FAMILY 5.10-like n=1 Tax=Papaver somniferum TaxID=3469 RepID=UPI000E6F9A92|nr:protein NRT1/ PTR FAMILY 5.10-like [Papaver somniferum]